MRLPSASVLVFTAFLAACGDDPKGKDKDTDTQEDCAEKDKITAWADADGDGFGDAAGEQLVCELGAGLADNPDDCNDASAVSGPGMVEVCDGLDNDCNTLADENLPLNPYYPDNDGDGYGVEGATIEACAAPANYADNFDDCDDTNPLNFPGNIEVCDTVDNDCDNRADDGDPDLDPSGALLFYADGDGDSYGDLATTRAACAQPSGWVTNSDDCNDDAAAINPVGLEVCNTQDDNCDGLTDEADPTLDTTTFTTFFEDVDLDTLGNPDATADACVPPPGFVANDNDCDDQDALVGAPAPWRPDLDDDGFGAPGAPLVACEAPVDHIPAAGAADCNDGNANVNPGETETCNATDDDCDALVDDADPSLDLATATLYHPDLDNDDYGNGDVDQFRCVQPATSVVDGSDCDDQRATVNPEGVEVCDDLDNDCNGLMDDEDPNVDSSDFLAWFPDRDEDGFGELSGAVLSCNPPAGFIDDANDCNDLDETVLDPALWYTDSDGDGHGVGLPVFGPDCNAPPGLAPEWNEFDCDDSTDAVSPSELDICEDLIDNDCDGQDLRCPEPESCAEYFWSNPSLPSGVYVIEPVPYEGTYDVWCDMDTDDGGWTLVASSANRPLTDAAGAYHVGLSTLEPGAQNPVIWGGLNDYLGADLVDVRFACKTLVTDTDMTVDLSFYYTDWYAEFTAGSDALSCFSEGDGAGYDLVPSRRDNLTGAYLPSGDDWAAGYLEGEDTCADPDFSVDFDDRGVAGDPNDGTDWGFADGVEKCGTAGSGEAWFLFVRRVPS